MNEQDYLPLYWLNHYGNKHTELFRNNLSIQEMRILTEDCYAETRKMMILRKKHRIYQLLHQAESAEQQIEILSEMNLYSLLGIWKKNKQIYRFDGDFLKELMQTDTLHFSKNAWNYLPCDTFYADISANQELCRQTGMQGFFCKVTNVPQKELWQIHVLAANPDTLDYGSLYAWNKDMELKTEDVEHNDLTELIEQEHGKKCEGNPITSVLVAQILTYLSSVELDMSEEPELYQKIPAPERISKPKGKQKKKTVQNHAVWSVGLRFGNAFRKWKVLQSRTENREVSESGRIIRPHHRSPHWQNYWYGKKDGSEERIRRPKWVNGCFVNLNLLKDIEELPAVIHEVKGA